MKRDQVGLAAICVAMFLAGAIAGSGRPAERAALAAHNQTLRVNNKVLRAQCPARPKLQRAPFEPGDTA